LSESFAHFLQNIGDTNGALKVLNDFLFFDATDPKINEALGVLYWFGIRTYSYTSKKHGKGQAECCGQVFHIKTINHILVSIKTQAMLLRVIQVEILCLDFRYLI
tara:strand:+ start:367 stop:681 length:315 start_codon:yes stop_codon:yes gene_type:complete